MYLGNDYWFCDFPIASEAIYTSDGSSKYTWFHDDTAGDDYSRGIYGKDQFIEYVYESEGISCMYLSIDSFTCDCDIDF